MNVLGKHRLSGGGGNAIIIPSMRLTLITIVILFLCSSLAAYDLYVQPTANPNVADGSYEHPFSLIQSAVDHIFDDTLPENQNTTSARIILLGSSVFNEGIVLDYNGESGIHLITDISIIGNLFGQERRTISAPVSSNSVISCYPVGTSTLRLEGLEVCHEPGSIENISGNGILVSSNAAAHVAFGSLVVDKCYFDYSESAISVSSLISCLNEIIVTDSEFMLRCPMTSSASIFVDGGYGDGLLEVSGSCFSYDPTALDPEETPQEAIYVDEKFHTVDIEDNEFDGVTVNICNDQSYHNTIVRNNEFNDSNLILRDKGTWLIEENSFVFTANQFYSNAVSIYKRVASNELQHTTVNRNLFVNIPTSLMLSSTGMPAGIGTYDVTNNSFIDCETVIDTKCWSDGDVIISDNRIDTFSNNLYKGTSSNPFLFVDAYGNSVPITEDFRIPITHSHFSTPLAPSPSLIIDDTVSYGDPLINYSELTHTYSLIWDETQKSPLINTGYPGENGELTDPDGTPPDIGCVYYPHVNRQYFERVNPIMWLSFPVLDDRSNTEGTYWNELGYMFEEHMQDAPNSQLDQVQWSYDGEKSSMFSDGGIWYNTSSNATQPKGYKVQFNTSGAISDLVVNGFRADPATTPVAWMAEIEENGQSRPFENWIGYFVPFREKAGNAFSHLVPGTNSRMYLDYIYSMKTQHWSTSRQSATHGSPWIIDPNKYTLSEGDMVSLILLPDAPQEMYWNNSSLNIDPREVAKSTAFSYEEELDYQPVYIEFDPENIPEEIGLYVGGVCKGAAVVDSSKISVCLYNDASKAGGDLELVFYYEGKGKSMSEGWTVYNPQSLVFENTGLRADQIGDYAYISFNREEGESPTPLVTSLRQNYPNPFNPSTTLSFVLGTESEANLDIFNARGQLMRSFRYDQLARGLHTVEWDGKDSTGRTVSSGLYFYRLRTPETSLVNKMLLLK